MAGINRELRFLGSRIKAVPGLVAKRCPGGFSYFWTQTPSASDLNDADDPFRRLRREHEDLEKLVAAGESVETTVRTGFILFTRKKRIGQVYDDAVVRARVLADEYIATETASRRSAALPGLAKFAVLPPLIVLLVGWAIGWAISGFRRTAWSKINIEHGPARHERSKPAEIGKASSRFLGAGLEI